MLPMLPMLLVDVVKFAVGSWSGRSASCGSFFHSAATSFLTSMCWAICFGVDWQVFQNNLFDSLLNKIKL